MVFARREEVISASSSEKGENDDSAPLVCSRRKDVKLFFDIFIRALCVLFSLFLSTQSRVKFGEK